MRLVEAICGFSSFFGEVIRFGRCITAEDWQERELVHLLLGEGCWHKRDVPG